MKNKKFKYTKKDGNVDVYDVMILADSPDYLAGIDLKKLSNEEIQEVIKIQEEYEQKLKPYMKAYRSFIKENIEG